MLKGIGRSPFGPRPRTPQGGAALEEAPSDPLPSSEPELATPAAPPPPPPEPVFVQPKHDEDYEKLKRAIHSRLVDRLDLNRVGEMDQATLRSEIRILVERLCDTENAALNRPERQRLVDEILDETFGFGPLELLLKDDKVADIMINGPKKIFVEKAGRITRSDVTFRDNDHLLQIIDRIVSRVGRRIDETSPMCDARLPNGSDRKSVV